MGNGCKVQRLTDMAAISTNFVRTSFVPTLVGYDILIHENVTFPRKQSTIIMLFSTNNIPTEALVTVGSSALLREGVAIKKTYKGADDEPEGRCVIRLMLKFHNRYEKECIVKANTVIGHLFA